MLLKGGKAKVVRRAPFQIKLLHGSSGYRQPIAAGIDTGSKTFGCAAITNGKVIYQSQVQLRTDIKTKMQRRLQYRRTRRSRKTRYRKARWRNRGSMKKAGRIPPTIRSKRDSHLRELKFVEKLFPITQWKIETAQFDIHKIVNPEVEGKDYQEGPQKGYYNTKAYVLFRDKYKCQSPQKREHSKKLQIHHVIGRAEGGSDAPSNLLTLCECCHDAFHRGEFVLKKRRRKQTFQVKHATQVSIISRLLCQSERTFEETFGYETKYKREQFLGWPKEHYYDAVAICLEEGQSVKPLNHVWYKRHVTSGDYQQTKGKRSEKRIPTGKINGFRKFDKIETSKGIGFVKGRMSTGYFVLMDIEGKTIVSCVTIKKNAKRLVSRSTTLIAHKSAFIPPLKQRVFCTHQG
jgi:hypothetical protein